MREKVNQFKEGDEVELISLTNTDNDHGVVEAMLNVGDRAFVDVCDGDTVFLKDDCFSYHIKDFKLIKSVEETNTSQRKYSLYRCNSCKAILRSNSKTGSGNSLVRVVN